MRITRLDLEARSASSVPVDPELQAQYLGGLGLSARMMADLDDPSLPPLHPDIPFLISVGSLTATGFPGANRSCFFGVSPLTGLVAGSWMGGNFGTAFARTGTMLLALEGRAAEPSIVVMGDEGIEVVPRSDLWGLTISQARARLAEDFPRARFAMIGPAGEHQVAMACVRGDEGHAAGRCGMGAALGSKNVKAIVATGGQRPDVADAEALRALNREVMDAVRQDEFLSDVQGPIGTTSLVEPVNEFHAFPTKNHQLRYFEGAPQIYGERIAEEYVVRRTTCPACPVRCRMHVSIDGEELEAAEYETVWAFGGDNCVDDYALIARANDRCNDLGLDTMSAGNTIAFFREYSNTFDDPSVILDLIEKIAYRRDEGDVLAQGTRAAAQEFGVDYAMQVKGLELAAYDPRKLTGMAISYSTANRGGCHSRSWTVADELSGQDFSGQELAEMVAAYHDTGCVRDSLIVCTFLNAVGQLFYPRALTHVLGREVDDEMLATTGERIYTLERALNVRRGVDGSEDVLPRRLMEGLVKPETYAAGMEAYYRLRGWDDEGRPTPEKLESLGIGFMA